MVFSGQNGGVGPSWCPHNGCSCIVGVLAIVNDVMEVKHQPLARAAVLDSPAGCGGGGGDEDEEEEEEES